MSCLRYCVCSSQNTTKMDQKCCQVLPTGHYLYDETTNCVIEVDYLGLVIGFIGILLVSVLVGVIIRDSAIPVPCWNNIQMIMNRPPLLLYNSFSLQNMECCLRVPAFNGIQMVLFSEVEFMDNMAGVEFIQMSFHLHLHEVIKISMTTYMEVSRNLLHCKLARQSAPILIFQCLSHILKLFLRILLPKKFIAASIKIISIFIEPPLLDGANVRMVRNHDIFQIKRNELTGEGGETNININAMQDREYVIYSRVKRLSILIYAIYSGLKQFLHSTKVKQVMSSAVTMEIQPPILVD